MSLMTTGLQFGYFLGLLFAVLLWIRGFREERLSDKLLGCVLFFLVMEIQDYTFGFAGINILWEKFEGWPRHFPWIFPASVYFYLQVQTNQSFRFEQKHLWHLGPYLVYVLLSVGSVLIGKARNTEPLNTIFESLYFCIYWFAVAYYFIKSIRFYRQYRSWTETQFSNIETVSFDWLRNFIYVFIIGSVLKFLFNIADLFMHLPFEEDYYWQLFTVFIIAYVGIQGYAQPQIKKINYEEKVLIQEDKNDKISLSPAPLLPEIADWKPKIERLFVEQKVFLEPELSLSDLAQKLKTNTSVLSAAVNQLFARNFNDFVNEYRVEEFKRQIQLSENKHLTLLAIAFDCGFNSKATFNRAVKKITGQSPKELLDEVVF